MYFEISWLVSRARATKLQYPQKDPVLQTFLIFWGQKTGSTFLHKVCQICPNCSKVRPEE